MEAEQGLIEQPNQNEVLQIPKETLKLDIP